MAEVTAYSCDYPDCSVVGPTKEGSLSLPPDGWLQTILYGTRGRAPQRHFCPIHVEALFQGVGVGTDVKELRV